MPKVAVIYCRVSSDRQATEGHGLDGQERRCREYAAAHGYTVAAVFRDEGASGGTFDRPALRALFDHLRRHRDVDLVLFEDVSRIARDMGVHIQVLSEITRLGAKYQTVNQPIEDTVVGKFIVQSLANVAELHRNLNAQNVKNRMKARLQAGYWVFPPPPGYTFQTVPGHGRLLVPDRAADTIREALEGFASGRFPTQAAVRKFLADRGLPHRRSAGRVYGEGARRVLTQLLYAGYLACPAWGVGLTKARHEPLVSLDTYYRVQDRLAQRPGMGQNRADMANDFPLRGFVLCGGCHKPYTACWSRGRGGKYRYYHCVHRGCRLRGKGVRGDVLERQFEELLGSVQPRPEVLELVQAALLGIWDERLGDVRGLVERQQRELDEIDRAIKKYCAQLLETDSPTVRRAYEEKAEELNVRKLRLGSRIEADAARLETYDFRTALDTVFGCLKDPLQMWKSGKLDLRRAVLRLVFSEPLVYDRGTGFRTTTLSLPLAIAATSGADLKRLVDLLRKSSNQVMEWVREAAEQVGRLADANEWPLAA